MEINQGGQPISISHQSMTEIHEGGQSSNISHEAGPSRTMSPRVGPSRTMSPQATLDSDSEIDDSEKHLSHEVCELLTIINGLGDQGEYQELLPSRTHITRVPQHLRLVNEKAYEPILLAIGPTHRNKDHLREMENYKVHYLEMLLKRRQEDIISPYMEVLNMTMKRAKTGSAKFPYWCRRKGSAAMLFLDGCFIIELLRKHKNIELRDQDDPIFDVSFINYNLKRDLLLIENQLPFPVIQLLFNMTMMNNEEHNLFSLILDFFEDIIPNPRENWVTSWEGESDHLLSFVHDIFLSLPPKVRNLFLDSKMRKETITETNNVFSISNPLEFLLAFTFKELRFLYLRIKRYVTTETISDQENPSNDQENPSNDPENRGFVRCATSDDQENWGFVRCATELTNLGIKFKKTESGSLFKLRFEKGVMEIPRLKIGDGTESLFQNLIAYEQLFSNEGINHISHYIAFMDCLIDTSKDVEALCKSKVIDNGLGEDQAIANMFNRLGKSIIFPRQDFLYAEICDLADKHCGNQMNRWMAILKRDYFNTPWALISLLAAMFLILLTITQTVIGILDYVYK